jgi:hypothetical protein
MNLSNVSRLDKRKRAFNPAVILYGLVLMAAAAGLTMAFIFLGVQAVNLVIVLFGLISGG